MIITGSEDTGSDAIYLYKDNRSLSNCTEFRSYGDNVCDDVILIPVSSEQHVRYVTISTNTVVTTCEVQIFAGNICFYDLVI